jgi:hypothetical protein
MTSSGEDSCVFHYNKGLQVLNKLSTSTQPTTPEELPESIRADLSPGWHEVLELGATPPPTHTHIIIDDAIGVLHKYAKHGMVCDPFHRFSPDLDLQRLAHSTTVVVRTHTLEEFLFAARTSSSLLQQT